MGAEPELVGNLRISFEKLRISQINSTLRRRGSRGIGDFRVIGRGTIMSDRTTRGGNDRSSYRVVTLVTGLLEELADGTGLMENVFAFVIIAMEEILLIRHVLPVSALHIHHFEPDTEDRAGDSLVPTGRGEGIRRSRVQPGDGDLGDGGFC